MEQLFPFSAFVGQKLIKKSLLAVLINPYIGGVLLRGEKGTAKSSLVRSLKKILPPVHTVDGCRWNCDPKTPVCQDCRSRLAQGETLRPKNSLPQLVELPLSATEDRLIGSLDLEQALQRRRHRFQPGLLAKANHGILYIDEVNLLPDHLMAVILDVSASGINMVQREGFSLEHQARFSLIGSMNPEEGELRPQFLDRFGLCVQVMAEADVESRLRIVKLKEQYDDDKATFIRTYEKEEKELAEKIIQARKMLPSIHLSPEFRTQISSEATAANCAGHRGEISAYHAAITLAAIEGRSTVEGQDVELALLLALAHRRRQLSPPPQQPPASAPHKADNHDENNQDEKQKPEDNDFPENEEQEQPFDEPPQADSQSATGETQEKIFEIGDPFKVKPIVLGKDRLSRLATGRRTKTATHSVHGRHIASFPVTEPFDLALVATLRAAAPHKFHRPPTELWLNIQPEDYRRKRREQKTGSLIVFVVDASGSMGVDNRMSATKGAVLSLLMDAYQKRDQVAFIAFRGLKADVLLPPTGSVERAFNCLQTLPTGGKTPLAAGLLEARLLIEAQNRKNDGKKTILILISDGRANVPLSGDSPFEEAIVAARLIAQNKTIFSLVIDTEKSGLIRFEQAAVLAEALNAGCLSIQDLKADDLTRSIKNWL
jgi:magnesium chelatase subunit D